VDGATGDFACRAAADTLATSVTNASWNSSQRLRGENGRRNDDFTGTNDGLRLKTLPPLCPFAQGRCAPPSPSRIVASVQRTSAGWAVQMQVEKSCSCEQEAVAPVAKEGIQGGCGFPGFRSTEKPPRLRPTGALRYRTPRKLGCHGSMDVLQANLTFLPVCERHQRREI